MEENRNDAANQCATCARPLDLGVDVIRTQMGVIGGRGFVPLEEALLFCCDRCAAENFQLDDSLPPRIP